MQRDSPRHIRDIAHLYLSRMRAPRGGPLRVAIAGVSADVIPGFHAANLALAAAVNGVTVRIVEASGLPVNAGCFLGLDPKCWVANGRPTGAVVSAFARVSFIRCSAAGRDASVTPEGNGDGDVMEIVHAPPWDAGEEHVQRVGAYIASPMVLLYVAARDEPPRPWLEWGGATNVAARVAFVTRTQAPPVGSVSAGVLTRWSAALTDPVPVVVRDPGSRLARQYRDVLSNLLAPATAGPSHHHATAIKSV